MTDVVVRPAAAEELDRLRAMFDALYVLQREQGMRSLLLPDGFERWSQALARSLGRFSIVLLAERGAEAVGFPAGRLRIPTPPFAGPLKPMQFADPPSISLSEGKCLRT